MDKQKKWDMRFIRLAAEVAGWSKDSSSQVGAVIVDQHNRIISTGYNGPPTGWDDTIPLDRDTKLAVTIHAEENAILFAAQPVRGMTLYVTHYPCAPCAAKIAQVGISRVVMPDQDYGFLRRWECSLRKAREVFHQSGVEVWHARPIGIRTLEGASHE